MDPLSAPHEVEDPPSKEITEYVQDSEPREVASDDSEEEVFDYVRQGKDIDLRAAHFSSCLPS